MTRRPGGLVLEVRCLNDALARRRPSRGVSVVSDEPGATPWTRTPAATGRAPTTAAPTSKARSESTVAVAFSRMRVATPAEQTPDAIDTYFGSDAGRRKKDEFALQFAAALAEASAVQVPVAVREALDYLYEGSAPQLAAQAAAAAAAAASTVATPPESPTPRAHERPGRANARATAGSAVP